MVKKVSIHLRTTISILKDRMEKLKYKAHHIDPSWCKGCGICVEFCPKQVLELDNDQKAVAVRPEDCICCRLCEFRCPDLAIEVICSKTEDGNE